MLTHGLVPMPLSRRHSERRESPQGSLLFKKNLFGLSHSDSGLGELAQHAPEVRSTHLLAVRRLIRGEHVDV